MFYIPPASLSETQYQASDALRAAPALNLGHNQQDNGDVARVAQEVIAAQVGQAERPVANSWLLQREMRYLVALQQLAHFSYQGENLSTLQEKVSNPSLKQAFQSILRAGCLLTNTPLGVREARKELYPRFLHELRNAITSIQDLDSEEAKIAHELCLAHFSIDIKDTEIGTKFTDMVLGSYKPSSIEGLEAAELQAAMNAGMPGKTLNIKFTEMGRRLDANNPAGSWDPVSYSVRSKITDILISDQQVSCLRMACPVLGANANPQIDPLFIGMLRALKTQGKCYLYINNQSADAQSDSRFNENELESRRVNALRELSSNPEFEGMFHVVSFAHDSEFYKRGSGSVELLKDGIIHHLMRGTQGYFLPEFLLRDSADIYATLQAILDEVHKQHFTDKEELNAVERKLFLHIAYAAIGKKIIEDLQVSFINITCKDGVDRAAGSSANLFAMADDIVEFKDLLWTLAFPAALNHARAPKEERHKISIEALKLILEKKMPKK